MSSSTGNTGPRSRLKYGLETGASGTLPAQDLADGIDDPREPEGEYLRGAASRMSSGHYGGSNPLKAFTSKGSAGKEFNAEGSVGSVPQKAGGPLDKEGVIGKAFSGEGIIGGTVNKLLGEKKK